MDGNLFARDGWALLGAHLDFLRITVSPADDARLCGWTAPDEAGHPRWQFERSERRTSPHGSCWRRWQPKEPSPGFGEGYASWEWDGGRARGVADSFRRMTEGTPAPRVSAADLAFDLTVPADMTPDQLTAEIEDPDRPGHTRPIAGHRRIIGVSGDGGVNTRYIGSRESPTRIRIYRKDLQDPTWLHGPTVRIELRLLHEAAHAIGRKLLHLGEAETMKGAVALIQAMTGWTVADEQGELPDIIPPEGSDLAGRMLAVLKQTASTLATMKAAGLDILALIDAQAAKASRMTQHRQKQLRQQIAPAAPEIQAMLMACIQGEPDAPAAAPQAIAVVPTPELPCERCGRMTPERDQIVRHKGQCKCRGCMYQPPC